MLSTVAGKVAVTGSGSAVHEIKVYDYESFVLSCFLLCWCFLSMPCGATALILLQWMSLERNVFKCFQPFVWPHTALTCESVFECQLND